MQYISTVSLSDIKTKHFVHTSAIFLCEFILKSSGSMIDILHQSSVLQIFITDCIASTKAVRILGEHICG